MQRKILNVQFPLGGVDQASGFQGMPPYVSNRAVNVRPIDSLSGRARGGSRPGLTKAYPTQLGSGNPIRLLSSVTTVRDDGFRYWADDFSGLTVGGRWSEASWIGASPEILPDDEASLEDVNEGGLVLDAITDLDTDKAYSLGTLILPYNGEHHGEYRLYARMNNTTPNALTDGIIASLVLTGSGGAFSGTLKVYKASVETSYTFTVTASPLGDSDGGWFILSIDGNVIKAYWRGNLLINQDITSAIGISAGNRVGFGMKVDTTGDDLKVCVVDGFQFKYYTNETLEEYRKQLVAVANGNLYVENLVEGSLELAGAENPLLASNCNLQAAEWGQQLFIADYGMAKVQNKNGTANVSGAILTSPTVSDWSTYSIDPKSDVVVIENGTGTVIDGIYPIDSSWSAIDKLILSREIGEGDCSFRVERAPKIFDPSTNSLTIWQTENYDSGLQKGSIPTGCSLICRYLDCLVLAGDRLDPHMWYMLRSGNPLDADYFADPDDPARAVAGNNSEAGRVGDPITCLVPCSDDYLIFGCPDSLYVLRGHPAYSGAIDKLSDIAGVVSAHSWCFGPLGEFIFLSKDGVYVMNAGTGVIPQRFSRERLPRQLLNIDPNLFEIQMEFDVQDYGVHLFITPKDSRGDCHQVHWWLDWKLKSYYQVTLHANHEPFFVYRYPSKRLEESRVLLGGRDGYLRSFRSSSRTDDGETIDSEVVLGPIRLGRADDEDGTLQQLVGILGQNSEDVYCDIRTGDSIENCLRASSFRRFTMTTVQRTKICKRAANCFSLTLVATGRWAMESIIARLMPHESRGNR